VLQGPCKFPAAPSTKTAQPLAARFPDQKTPQCSFSNKQLPGKMKNHENVAYKIQKADRQAGQPRRIAGGIAWFCFRQAFCHEGLTWRFSSGFAPVVLTWLRRPSCGPGDARPKASEPRPSQSFHPRASYLLHRSRTSRLPAQGSLPQSDHPWIRLRR